MPLDSDTKRRLSERIQKDPEFFERCILSHFEKREARTLQELFQANRTGTLEQIKYAQGRHDEALEVIRAISGTTPKAEKPAAPGLMARILGRQGD